MTKKRDDNVLALGPMASDFSTAKTNLVPWSSRWPLTKGEERLTKEAHKQQLAIDIIAAKARFGASKIGEIHQHASLTFDEATSCIIEVKGRPERSQQHQSYVDQFSERQIQLLAQHSLAVLDVGATGIGMEIHRSPYPPPPPKPKPERHIGFLEWLLGSRK